MGMKIAEVTLWSLGALLIALFVGVLSWQEIERRHEIAAFVEVRRNLPRPTLIPPQLQPLPESALQPARVVAPKLVRVESNQPDDIAMAVLRIPAIGLVVPVNPGTGRSELLRGAGLVAGSALPGSIGNIAIAAHRDSYFRGLRNISVGDVVELDTIQRTDLYRVTSMKVVEPTDVNVLADVGKPVLTLITCYPFHFIGNAPHRFIVRAVATDIRR